MSKLVEMIEALQAKWREVARTCKVSYSQRDRDISEGVNSCADDLSPILAAAREQSRDLTEAVASRNSWKEQWKLRCEMLFKQVDITEKLEQELATMKEQHSDDLREIAEMAMMSMANWCGDFGPAKRPTADSIVREFREKKAEVKAHARS